MKIKELERAQWLAEGIENINLIFKYGLRPMRVKIGNGSITGEFFIQVTTENTKSESAKSMGLPEIMFDEKMMENIKNELIAQKARFEKELSDLGITIEDV